MSKRDYEVSLTDNVGRNIKDIYGYFSDDFGDPVFQLTRIEFVTGETMDVEGEHDCPYLSEGSKTNLIRYPPESKEEE
jgi:hypothetical protein